MTAARRKSRNAYPPFKSAIFPSTSLPFPFLNSNFPFFNLEHTDFTIDFIISSSLQVLFVPEKLDFHGNLLW